VIVSSYRTGASTFVAQSLITPNIEEGVVTFNLGNGANYRRYLRWDTNWQNTDSSPYKAQDTHRLQLGTASGLADIANYNFALNTQRCARLVCVRGLSSSSTYYSRTTQISDLGNESAPTVDTSFTGYAPTPTNFTGWYQITSLPVTIDSTFVGANGGNIMLAANLTVPNGTANGITINYSGATPIYLYGNGQNYNLTFCNGTTTNQNGIIISGTQPQFLEIWDWSINYGTLAGSYGIGILINTNTVSTKPVIVHDNTFPNWYSLGPSGSGGLSCPIGGGVNTSNTHDMSGLIAFNNTFDFQGDSAGSNYNVCYGNMTNAAVYGDTLNMVVANTQQHCGGYTDSYSCGGMDVGNLTATFVSGAHYAPLAEGYRNNPAYLSAHECNVTIQAAGNDFRPFHSDGLWYFAFLNNTVTVNGPTAGTGELQLFSIRDSARYGVIARNTCTLTSGTNTGTTGIRIGDNVSGTSATGNHANSVVVSGSVGSYIATMQFSGSPGCFAGMPCLLTNIGGISGINGIVGVVSSTSGTTPWTTVVNLPNGTYSGSYTSGGDLDGYPSDCVAFKNTVTGGFAVSIRLHASTCGNVDYWSNTLNNVSNGTSVTWTSSTGGNSASYSANFNGDTVSGNPNITFPTVNPSFLNVQGSWTSGQNSGSNTYITYYPPATGWPGYSGAGLTPNAPSNLRAI
jgi:hypothetical protein